MSCQNYWLDIGQNLLSIFEYLSFLTYFKIEILKYGHVIWIKTLIYSFYYKNWICKVTSWGCTIQNLKYHRLTCKAKGQKLVISPFQSEISDVPAGCLIRWIISIKLEPVNHDWRILKAFLCLSLTATSYGVMVSMPDQ